MKGKQVRLFELVIVVIILVGGSTLLGDYAAMQMAGQSVVKNAQLCQLLILVGVVAGSAAAVVLEARKQQDGTCRRGDERVTGDP
jgi:hypothetical protein